MQQAAGEDMTTHTHTDRALVGGVRKFGADAGYDMYEVRRACGWAVSTVGTVMCAQMDAEMEDEMERQARYLRSIYTGGLL